MANIPAAPRGKRADGAVLPLADRALTHMHKRTPPQSPISAPVRTNSRMRGQLGCRKLRIEKKGDKGPRFCNYAQPPPKKLRLKFCSRRKSSRRARLASHRARRGGTPSRNKEIVISGFRRLVSVVVRADEAEKKDGAVSHPRTQKTETNRPKPGRALVYRYFGQWQGRAAAFPAAHCHPP